MKLLFTSVGRRVELMQAFKNAAEKLNEDVQLFGADISDTAPALSFCDHAVIVPRINSNEYLPSLKEICKKEGIDALIPTIDTDLLLLAQHKEEFENTKVFISAPEKIALCRDKRLTSGYFKSIGLLAPETTADYRDYTLGFPAFIKPKDGSSSIFAFRVENEAELETYAGQVPDYIIQPYIDGVEYTVDVFCDYDGNPVLITPRVRIAVRSGEVLKTRIAQDKRIILEIRKLISDFKPCGQITVQLIREKASGDDYFIEINPRFGGGAPLSIKAGADSAEMLIRSVKGEKLNYIDNAAEDGAFYARFDQSIRIEQ